MGLSSGLDNWIPAFALRPWRCVLLACFNVKAELAFSRKRRKTFNHHRSSCRDKLFLLRKNPFFSIKWKEYKLQWVWINFRDEISLKAKRKRPERQTLMIFYGWIGLALLFPRAAEALKSQNEESWRQWYPSLFLIFRSTMSRSKSRSVDTEWEWDWNLLIKEEQDAFTTRKSARIILFQAVEIAILFISLRQSRGGIQS